MIDGKLNCVVECNPLLGPQFYDAVMKVMKHQKLPKETVTI